MVIINVLSTIPCNNQAVRGTSWFTYLPAITMNNLFLALENNNRFFLFHSISLVYMATRSWGTHIDKMPCKKPWAFQYSRVGEHEYTTQFSEINFNIVKYDNNRYL